MIPLSKKDGSDSEVNIPVSERVVMNFVLFGRYSLVPMYIGLTIGMILYDLSFFKELCELFKHPFSNSEESLLVGFLGLVDMTMVANLVLMITIGGYSIFINEIHVNKGKLLPRFLNNLS